MSVGAGDSVSLDGSGSSDADGQIQGYVWNQLSGPPVTLMDANAATASFVAPDQGATLVFALSVTDSDGTEDTDEVTISVTGTGNVIAGSVSYERVAHVDADTAGLDFTNIQVLPARRVRVEAVSESLGNLVATAVTDDEGQFSMQVPPGENVHVRVLARSQQAGAPGWDIRVVDNTASGALYALESEPVSPGGPPVQFVAATGWGGSGYSSAREAAPLAILDTVLSGVDFVLADDPSLDLPSLFVNWSENNRPVDGNLADGEISGTFYFNNQIYLLGEENTDTEEFDEHVILHEFAHYLQDNISRDDTLGGPHSLGERLDPRLAFSEGTATAVAALVLADPFYKDSCCNQQAGGFSFSNAT